MLCNVVDVYGVCVVLVYVVVEFGVFEIEFVV